MAYGPSDPLCRVTFGAFDPIAVARPVLRLVCFCPRLTELRHGMLDHEPVEALLDRN